MSGVVAVTSYGVYSAYEAGEQADKDRDLSREQLERQNEISERQVELAEDQWDSYVNNILPLEIEAQELGVDAQRLAMERGERDAQLYNDFYAPLQEEFVTDAREGIQPQYDRVARDAAETVDQQFDREEGILQRTLERKGVRPDSGSYSGASDRMSMAQAAARADAMNTSRENERDRVETTNFNRKAVALGRTPMGSQPVQSSRAPGVSPSQSASLMRSASSGYGLSAANYMNSANQNYANSSAALSGGITAGANLYSQFAPSTSPQFQYEQAYNFNGNMTPEPFGPQTYADGGPVLRRDYSSGGRVEGPEGVDQVPAMIESSDGNTYDARLTDGEYVIPVDVVMAKGTEFFDRLIEKHHKQRMPGDGKALTRRMH